MLKIEGCAQKLKEGFHRGKPLLIANDKDKESLCQKELLIGTNWQSMESSDAT